MLALLGKTAAERRAEQQAAQAARQAEAAARQAEAARKQAEAKAAREQAAAQRQAEADARKNEAELKRQLAQQTADQKRAAAEAERQKKQAEAAALKTTKAAEKEAKLQASYARILSIEELNAWAANQTDAILDDPSLFIDEDAGGLFGLGDDMAGGMGALAKCTDPVPLYGTFKAYQQACKKAKLKFDKKRCVCLDASGKVWPAQLAAQIPIPPGYTVQPIIPGQLPSTYDSFGRALYSIANAPAPAGYALTPQYEGQGGQQDQFGRTLYSIQEAMAYKNPPAGFAFQALFAGQVPASVDQFGRQLYSLQQAQAKQQLEFQAQQMQLFPQMFPQYNQQQYAQQAYYQQQQQQYAQQPYAQSRYGEAFPGSGAMIVSSLPGQYGAGAGGAQFTAEAELAAQGAGDDGDIGLPSDTVMFNSMPQLPAISEPVAMSEQAVANGEVAVADDIAMTPQKNESPAEKSVAPNPIKPVAAAQQPSAQDMYGDNSWMDQGLYGLTDTAGSLIGVALIGALVYAFVKKK